MDYEVRNNLLESENQLYKSELKARLDKIKELENELEYVRTIKDSAEETLEEVREENRKLKEMCDVYVPRALKLEEENKKLKEDNRFLTKISKEYMKKENIIQVTEFTELYKDKLEEKIRFLEQCLDNKEKVNKSMREDNKSLREENKWYEKEEDRLREEIRNLKLTLEQMENTCKDYLNDRDTLREENRNLKERIKELEKEIEELNKMMLFETKI